MGKYDEPSATLDGAKATVAKTGTSTFEWTVTGAIGEANDATPDDTVVFTNNKKVDVDTGITLDSLPFVLILAVCAGAVVLFVIKRRNSVEF